MAKRKAVPVAAGAVAVILVGFMVLAMTAGSVSGASPQGKVRPRAARQGMHVTHWTTITMPKVVSAGSTDEPTESPDPSDDSSESDEPIDDSTQSPEPSDDPSETATNDTSDDQTSSDNNATGGSTDDSSETSTTFGDD